MSRLLTETDTGIKGLQLVATIALPALAKRSVYIVKSKR